MPSCLRKASNDDGDAEALRVQDSLAQVLITAKENGDIGGSIASECDQIQDDQTVDALLPAGTDAAESQFDAW